LKPLCLAMLQVADDLGRLLLRKVDERWSLKRLHPRAQSLARLLIIGTYVDDILRVATDYAGQRESMQLVGFPAAISYMLPVLFVAVQGTGVVYVLCGTSMTPQYGCLILAVWTAVHPFLYLQHHNLEFVLESLTLIGGLCILASSERVSLASKRAIDSTSLEAERTDKLQLVGRVCTSAVFVYYVVKMTHERIQSLLGNTADEEVMTAVAEGLLLALLLVITGLIVVGVRSRWCAGVLAIIMSVCALYKHPWFLTLGSSKMYKLDFIVGYEGTQVSSWLYSDYQRYFFFQQISTAGALLQLVVHGPGKYSIDEAQGPIELVTATWKGAD